MNSFTKQICPGSGGALTLGFARPPLQLLLWTRMYRTQNVVITPLKHVCDIIKCCAFCNGGAAFNQFRPGTVPATNPYNKVEFCGIDVNECDDHKSLWTNKKWHHPRHHLLFHVFLWPENGCFGLKKTSFNPFFPNADSLVLLTPKEQRCWWSLVFFLWCLSCVSVVCRWRFCGVLVVSSVVSPWCLSVYHPYLNCFPLTPLK